MSCQSPTTATAASTSASNGHPASERPSGDSPQQNGGLEKAVYSLSEVARHKDSQQGVWISMDGKVYDVSEWMNEVSGNQN
jgi:cytochrome b involved in lipid metabolism